MNPDVSDSSRQPPAGPSAEPAGPQRQSLTVLPSSGKVDQLRQDVQRDQAARGAGPASAGPPAPARGMAHQTVIDRALDASKSPQQKAVEEKVIEVLRTIYDPEIPVNIYDLGLIYRIDVAGDNRVHVQMTLTAPACPVAGTLPPEVERRIETIDEVPAATVELVWEPQWGRERMSEAALLELGLL